MFRYCCLALLLSYNALCISEECVTYNFEENQKANFTNTYGICQGLSSWDVGEYSSLSTDSPHRDSTVFIQPRTNLSCISSFKFSVTSSGIFELNMYMEPAHSSDQITLLVFRSVPGANDATVANAVLSPNFPNFVAGWQTMRVKIMSLGTYEGYITLLGMASTSSTVLVDSFRYIAPTYDKDSCVIYPDAKPTTEIPTEVTTTSDTIETSTTPAKPSTITIPTIYTTKATEKTPLTTYRSTLTLPTVPVTRTSEGPGTISIPTIPVTTTTEKKSTIAILSSPVTRTTENPSTNIIYETTTRVTTPSSTTQTTSTERPRLSVSILLIKIKKFFR